MKIVRRLIGAGMLCALAAGAAWAADQDCRLRRYAKLPMSLDEAGAVTVPMTVAGQQVQMLVDTGGITSSLTEGAAARLKLNRAILKDIGFTVFGGKKLQYYVEAPFTLGPGTVPSHSFVLLPDDVLVRSNDGLLSTDILAAFDVDFDFANGLLSLFLPHPCKGNAVWWTKDDYAAVSFKLDEGRHVKLTVKLDGKDVPGEIDTGSTVSFMSLETAKDLFAISDEQLSKNGGTYPFKTLSFGGITVLNPQLRLYSDKKSKVMGGYEQPALIVGMGVLRQLHMLIAYKSKELYVTPASAH